MNIAMPRLMLGSVIILLQPKVVIIIEVGSVSQSSVRKMDPGAQTEEDLMQENTKP